MSRYVDINSKEVTHLISNLEPRWKPMDEMTRDEQKVAFKELNSIAEAFLALPTADVVEVRHGEWVWKGRKKRCSRCGVECPEDKYNYMHPQYCCSCGAKMDVERREDTE